MDNDGVRVFAFLKIGRREHMEALRDRGVLFCNTVGYFKTLEERQNTGRADRDEGLEAVFQPSKIGSIQIGNVMIPPHDLAGVVTVSYDDAINDNIFCLYGATNTPTVVDPRCEDFGDTAVFIMNPREFLRRLREKLTEMKIGWTFAPVVYVDRASHHGPMGPFRKYSEFAYQSEMRLWLEGSTGQPVTLEIGSLTDISSIHKIEKR